MGKKGGTSWLTAVKRAFRSPTKENDKVRSCRRKEDHHREEEIEDDKKQREKRRWIFRKGNQEIGAAAVQQQSPQKAVANAAVDVGGSSVPSSIDVSGAAEVSSAEQRHAIAVAVATAAASASAQAAMEAARLNATRPDAREHNAAATIIQTAFRGYLARRALRALKGLVKLQALARGHNVRKQAKMTLKCMQALVRVQARVRDQRLRLSHEEGGSSSRKSAFSDTNSLLESRYLQDIAERRSLSHSREPSSLADDWDERPHSIEEVKAMLQSRKEAAAFQRDKSLSRAFSQQVWRSDRSSVGGEDDLEEKPKWLDRWMATKQWEMRGRASTDHRARSSTDQRDHPIKTVEMDTSQPYSYLAPPPSYRRPNHQHHHQNQYQYQYQRPASPQHRAVPSQHNNLPPHHPSPATPSPARSRTPQVRSASPRCVREERTSTSCRTPSLRSNYHYTGQLHPHNNRAASSASIGAVSSASTAAVSGGGSMPNYMAATESAKARLRSQSAPRQRPSTPERDRGGGGAGGVGSAKKRLSFPVPDPYSGLGYGGGYGGHNLRSPSFKSVNGGVHFGTEQQSNYSSCCTDSLGGEISPSSTNDLRRWLR